MPIKKTDIVIYQSQDNTDNDNGGGSRTSAVLPDGEVNNLFPDISRIDTVGGDVAMRKVFPVVTTNNREIYYGAHAIIRNTPEDPKVSSLLFHTDDPTDTRSEAQGDVEAYLVPSYQASFYLFGSNVEGAKALTFLQRVEEEIPSVGEVFLLREGAAEQYIRISNIETAEVPYFFNTTEYVRRRIIATIEQPLEREFTGSTFNPAGRTPSSAETFSTQQADGAKFYGTKDLAVDGNIGDTDIQVDSIFESLVPATKQQVPLVNLEALSQNQLLVGDLLAEPTSSQVTKRINNGTALNGLDLEVQNILPGSFESSGFSDDGEGTLTYNSTGSLFSIDYMQGIVTWIPSSPTGGSGFSNGFKYIPGKLLNRLVQYSKGIKIDLTNQGNVFVQNVAPIPKSENCYIDYRSNGKWYRLNGNPDGSIGGQEGLGAASINNNGDGTATISMTLGAVPDLDSTIIVSWGSDDPITKVTQEARDNYEMYLEWDLPDTNLDRNSLGVMTYAASSRGTTNNIDWSTIGPDNAVIASTGVGDAVFSIDLKRGKISMRPVNRGAAVFPRNTNPVSSPLHYIELSYNYASEPTSGQDGEVKFQTDVPVTDNSGVYQFSLGESIQVANARISFRDMKYQHAITPTRGFQSVLVPSSEITLKSDNAGILRDGAGVARGTILPDGTGTIDYGTVSRKTSEITVIDGKTEYKYVTKNVPRVVIFNSELTNVEYTTTAILGSAYTNNVASIQIPNHSARLKIEMPTNVIGDFSFKLFNSQDLSVLGQDVIYNGNVVGVYDKTLGLIDIDYSVFSEGTTFNASTFIPGNLVVEDTNAAILLRRAIFRTASQDLVTSSLIVRYENENGVQTATTNSSGEFVSGDGVDLANSYVDTETGMAYVEFTNSPIPGTIKYDAVAQSTLPLDPELLGLNPIRLPPDGRVPLFEAGRFLVIFSEDETAISTPVANGTASSGRTDVALLEVVDVNGQRLAYDQYTEDKAAGTVTFADPLNLVDRSGNPLTGPYRLIDRIEDMAMCVDADVTGRVSLSAALTKNYMAGNTKVASALVWGDVGARVFNIFSQQLFDVWSDDQTQNPTTAQFDNTNFPIQIDNFSSFSGRWALIFTSSTTVDVVSEKLGVLIEDATINADISPINPATGAPYFTIPTGGWGGGWVTSNVLRFNTESGDENMWLIRTVQSGTLTVEQDGIDVEVRGDVNNV